VGDYIIYIISFLLPNFVALVLLFGYLIAYISLRPDSHSLFLTYPVVAVPFMIYYLVIKMMTFIGNEPVTEGMEVPLIIDPLCHAIIFSIVLRKLTKNSQQSSDELTIKDDSFMESFLAV
jgi:predicted neutral ceramidase superfamily lipid hydrolase